MQRIPSTSTVWAAEAMVCSVDHLASRAGVEVMARGGTAVDAAVAANAVLAVTQQQMCGLGGDLWALVHAGGEVVALNASGRAGSGADADALRAAGHAMMPNRGSVAAAPVPGCVDGWVALHERFGELELADLLAPAIDLAERGFAASTQLAHSTALVSAVEGNSDLVDVSPGQIVRRPGVARTLRAVVAAGRSGFYGGEFGEALVALGGGEYSEADLATRQADWVDAPVIEAWGHHLYTTPPNSQGYLNLAGAAIAAGLDLPDDPDDPLFGHFLIEAARAAAFDRPIALHEHADPAALLDADRLAERRGRIDADRTRSWGDVYQAGGTMYLCAIDGEGTGVSLIQSNAQGYGAHLCVGDTGVFLHNRGLGFSLEPGHPAEYGPGRRPPHTLAPAVITGRDGALRAVLGTMGGDAQPQIVLQMMARLLHVGQSPGQILSAGRFGLASPDASTGFDTWSASGDVVVRLEPHTGWAEGLQARGHRLEMADAGDGFGHAHLIEVTGAGTLAGASDPRAKAGAALGR